MYICYALYRDFMRAKTQKNPPHYPEPWTLETFFKLWELALKRFVSVMTKSLTLLPAFEAFIHFFSIFEVNKRTKIEVYNEVGCS